MALPVLFWNPNRLRYLLRDEFHTNLAAGSVEGTPAEPGPGTREVVSDTNSKMSITGGELSLATGGAGAMNPSCWYEAVSRIAGRVLLTEVIQADQLTGLNFGWDSNQAPSTLTDSIQFVSNNTIKVDRLGHAALIVGAFSAVTNYKLAIVLRVSGTYFFIKGGAFTDWTLLWEASTGTGAGYPTIAALDNTSVYTSSFIRIPKDLWLPCPLLSDSFNRANGALGIADGAGHAEANGGGGRAWNNEVGTTQIATNAASASALVGGIAIATVDAGNINVLHEAELTRSAGNVGIVLRYADTSNYVYAYHDGTNAVLVKVVAGTPTTVITAAATYAAGAVMRVICDGTSFSFFYNNAKVGSTETISDAGLQTGTEVGLYSSDTGNSQDDCVTWQRKGYSKLDKF